MGFSPSDQLTITKGSLVLLAMVLAFIVALVAVYLWYEIRLEEIDRSIMLLNP